MNEYSEQFINASGEITRFSLALNRGLLEAELRSQECPPANPLNTADMWCNACDYGIGTCRCTETGRP